jgi:lipid II:glycine glycyltransferase (peptidoglycan interpeptide bridge formation enzyme)
MQIKNIENQTEWDDFIVKNSLYSPLTQSFEWGEILKKESKEVERLGVYENDVLVAVALVVYSLVFGKIKYAFCPKGPVVKNQESGIKNQEFGKIEGEVYKVLSSYLKNKNCVFFRIEPELLTLQAISYKLSPSKKTIDIEPRATLFLDLKKTTEELLTGMHQKTRYNIKLAEKKGLEIIEKKDAVEFISLLKQTGERDNFRLHEDVHYEKIIASPLSKQLMVYFEGKLIAGGVFIGYGNTFTYLYGASNYEFRSTMAPYLIQWKAIQLGKSLGYSFYDFYGVAPQVEIKNTEPLNFPAAEYVYDEHHKHSGFTRFKLGFGGVVEQNVGTWDTVLKPMVYRVYEVVRKIRRLM